MMGRRSKLRLGGSFGRLFLTNSLVQVFISIPGDERRPANPMRTLSSLIVIYETMLEVLSY